MIQKKTTVWNRVKKFIKTITPLRDMGEERRIVWGYIVEHCNYETEYIIVDQIFHGVGRTNELLKKISEKTEILGSVQMP
jgi:hypothetical protein